MAASFNMQDFNEILEKCRDQSQQKKQDQVSEKIHFVIHQKLRRKCDSRISKVVFLFYF
jgi:hypothetical protein